MWNSFDVDAESDKAALLKYFYYKHDISEKPNLAQCFKDTFVIQPDPSRLDACEEKWFVKIRASINIKKMVLPTVK